MNYNVIAAPRMNKKDVNGYVPLYLFVYNGSKLLTKKSLGYKIPPEMWNKEQRKINKKFPNADAINILVTKEIDELRTKLILQEIETGAMDLPLLMKKDKRKEEICFYDFAEKQIKEKDYAPETRRAYRNYISKLKAYSPSLRLSGITFRFLQTYEAYLRNTLHNEQNTVWSNIKFLRTMMNDAVKSKHVTDDPFKDYKRPKYKQTDRTFLSIDEINAIEKYVAELKSEDKILKKVGNYFLFMTYTGLRFSDTSRIDETIVINNERVVIKTQKTKQIANIFINDKIRPLIDFVIDNPFGTMTGQEFNRKLKVIAAGAGIKKKVSSHVARHSFGASLVSLGEPEKVAQGLLAHGDIQPASYI